MTRTLDARPSPNPARLTKYPLAAVLGGIYPRSYHWNIPLWLDQGREGACVGFAWAHEAVAKPITVTFPRQASRTAFDFARELYEWAKKHDYWPGEDYDGTSVDAGAQGMRHFGMLREWRWTNSSQELAAWTSRRGPAVLGIPMYTGMMDPDSNGFLRITGKIEGWHAIVNNGFNAKGQWHTVHNSWGKDWGVNGKARIHDGDMARLLEEGEACIPIGRKP